MKVLSALISVLCCALIAGVDYDTTIRNVDYRGNHQRAGNIRWKVHNDNLATATPEHPIYLTLSLTSGALLAETLVEQSGAPAVALPINLPLQLDGQPGVTVAALPDAMRIVRWVAGESRIWLEMRQSSDQWLTNGIETFGPDIHNEVYFTIGLSARESNQLHVLGTNANLPFATRLYAPDEKDISAAVSVLLNLDLRQSSLLADGSYESLLIPNLEYWESDVNQGGGVFQEGTPLLCVVFTYEFAFARGKQRSCAQTNFQAGPPMILPGPEGMIRIRSQLTANFGCTTGSNFLPTTWAEGSRLILRAKGHNVGFGLDSQIVFTQGWSSYALVRPESAFQVGGLTLYREVELIYTGPDRETTLEPLDFDLELIYPRNLSTPPAVEIETILLPWATAEDSSPYHQPYQHAAGEPQPYAFAPQTVALAGPSVPTLNALGLTALISLFLLFGLWRIFHLGRARPTRS